MRGRSSSAVVVAAFTAALIALTGAAVIGLVVIREKTRQGRALFGSSTYQPKASSPNSAKTSPVRKVQAVVAAPQSHSDSERGLSGSDFDGALRRIYLAAAEGDARAQTASPQDTYPATLNQVSPSRKPGYDQRPPPGRDLLQQ
ncbi:hypothetical protein GQ600_24763 [Phytophthora cactorum]|nr:hypothetical protein GQ600_24763 [Phytophthora cactorum]